MDLQCDKACGFLSTVALKQLMKAQSQHFKLMFTTNVHCLLQVLTVVLPRLGWQYLYMGTDLAVISRPVINDLADSRLAVYAGQSMRVLHQQICTIMSGLIAFNLL